MKSWNQNKAKVILLAAGMLFLFVNLSACGTRMDGRQSGFWGSKQDPSIISDEDIRRFVAGVRPYLRSPQAHFSQGILHQSRHQHELAVEEFNKVLRQDPEHIKALNARGVSSDILGDYGTALKSYHAALKLDPELDFVYNNLGYSYYLQGNYTQAVKAFEKAVQLNDEYPVYQNNLGMAYARKGEFEKALARFERRGESEVGAEPEVGRLEPDVGDRRSDVSKAEEVGGESEVGAEPEVGDRRSDVGKAEEGGVEPDVGRLEPEVGDRMSEVSKAEEVGVGPDVGDRTSEIGKAEEVGDRMSEVGKAEEVDEAVLTPDEERAASRHLYSAKIKRENHAQKPLHQAAMVPEPAPEILPAARVQDTEIEETQEQDAARAGDTQEAVESLEPVQEKSAARSESRLHAVQVGAYAVLSYAADFYLSLVEKGYNAYINEPRSDNLYRVRIGLYNSEKDAQIAARSLEQVENLDNFVTVERRPGSQIFAAGTADTQDAALDQLREIPLEVLNGNGVRGFARRTSGYLAENDYLVQRIADARHFNFSRTKVFYRPEHEQAAQILAQGLPEKGRLKQVDPLALEHPGIRIILGRDLVAHADRLNSIVAGLSKKEEAVAYQAQ